MKANLDNLPVLLAEIKSAMDLAEEQRRSVGEYAEGYADGLSMALSILDGLVD